MVVSPHQLEQLSSATPSAWAADRPKKGLNYYEAQKEIFKDYISGNELITIPSVLEAFPSRMLTIDVKTRKSTGISREIIAEVLKSLNIAPKCWPEDQIPLWNILLAAVKDTKTLAGSILTRKLVMLQTEYLGI